MPLDGHMWQVAVGVVGGLVLLWAALVAVLYVAGRRAGERAALTDVLRLLPDVVRLLRRLAADPDVPRSVRVKLGLLLGYLVFPIDLVPDFVPVVGYADDAIIVALALRSVSRSAGSDALDRHWPGTPEGLRALKRLANLPA